MIKVFLLVSILHVGGGEFNVHRVVPFKNLSMCEYARGLAAEVWTGYSTICIPMKIPRGSEA